MAKKKKIVKKEKENTKKDSEKVCETFEIEKTSGKNKGKEEVKTVCGNIPKKHADKKEVEKYDSILSGFMIIFIAAIIFLVIQKDH